MATEPGELSAGEVRLNRLLNLILEMAVEVMGYDAATVTARHADQTATVAATDQRYTELDEAQYETGEGPCLTVLEPHEPIFLDAAGEDPDDRWEYFAQTAAHLGVESSLSMHIPLDTEQVAASLNFYSKAKRQLGADELQVASSFAQQLAAAMVGLDAYRATAALATGMAEAMRSRAVIEQAKGMLIAQHGGTPDEAFERLRHLSQHSNIKLRDVAQRIVDEHVDRADS
jgi:GAF domain-containing protein